MNRLQKKCLAAAVGAHFLLVVALLCSAFIRPAPKPDTTPVLDIIPTTAIDALLNSGQADAPPPPAPAPRTPPAPTPTPTPPAPTPPTPAPPTPDVPRVEPTPPERTEPDDTQPIVRTEQKPKHVVKVDLTKLVTRNAPKPPDVSVAKAEAEKAAKEAQHQRDLRARAWARAADSIRSSESSSTEVILPGISSESYASYGTIVISVYHRAWVPPENMTSDSAVVSFAVTIARDGTVLSSHITSPSGEPNVDRAVQRMLDRVTFIHEFPDDTKDRERTYHIDFNATRTSIQ